jgi:hypothetical protein
VIRISVPYVYNLSEALMPLASMNLVDSIKSKHAYALYNAHSTLHMFLYSCVWKNCLRVRKAPGQKLLDAEVLPLDNDEEIEFTLILPSSRP